MSDVPAWATRLASAIKEAMDFDDDAWRTTEVSLAKFLAADEPLRKLMEAANNVVDWVDNHKEVDELAVALRDFNGEGVGEQAPPYHDATRIEEPYDA